MGEPVTLVLGLGREIGGAIARTFAEDGHRVLVADPSAERLEQAAEALDGEDAATYHGELHTSACATPSPPRSKPSAASTMP